MRKHIRKVTILLFGLMALAGLSLAMILGIVWVTYRSVSITPPPGISVSKTKVAIIVRPNGSAGLHDAVVVFPANLVHPSQYQQFAFDLSAALRRPVLIVKPTLRLENFAPSSAAIQHALPAVQRWNYIGHSAGAAAACRAAANAERPHIIVTIAGYCAKPHLMTEAFFLTNDSILRRGQHGSTAAHPTNLAGSDHFFVTNHAVNSVAYQQLLRSLILLLADT